MIRICRHSSCSSSSGISSLNHSEFQTGESECLHTSVLPEKLPILTWWTIWLISARFNCKNKKIQFIDPIRLVHSPKKTFPWSFCVQWKRFWITNFQPTSTKASVLSDDLSIIGRSRPQTIFTLTSPGMFAAGAEALINYRTHTNWTLAKHWPLVDRSAKNSDKVEVSSRNALIRRQSMVLSLENTDPLRTICRSAAHRKLFSNFSYTSKSNIFFGDPIRNSVCCSFQTTTVNPKSFAVGRCLCFESHFEHVFFAITRSAKFDFLCANLFSFWSCVGWLAVARCVRKRRITGDFYRLLRSQTSASLMKLFSGLLTYELWRLPRRCTVRCLQVLANRLVSQFKGFDLGYVNWQDSPLIRVAQKSSLL